MKFCQCGCGQVVNYSKQYKRWSKFIQGHNTRVWSKEVRAKQTASMRKTKQSIEGRKRQSKAIKNMFNKKPELKENLSTKVKELWQDKDYRNTMVTSSKKYWSKPKSRERMSEATNRRFEDENQRVEISRTLKKYYKDNPGLMLGKNGPNYGKKHIASDSRKKKMSVAALERYSEIEERIKVSCWHQGISREEWTHFIRNNPYCQEFTKDLKNFIKERDSNKCQNPDCWENSDRLGVHHIDYDKKNCKIENLVAICTSCNSRANGNKIFWEATYSDIAIRNQRGEKD